MTIPLSRKRSDLNQEIADCRRCDGLNIPCETMSAPAHGVMPAELMVVGQSLHGYNQNTSVQIPFIGPVAHSDSGKLLYAMLQKNGYAFEKGNLLVTNVVHCHPPNNRPSHHHERENCRQFLSRELTLAQPKILLTLGSDARTWFQLRRQTPPLLVQCIGRTAIVQVYHPVICVVSVHPSYVRRFGGKCEEEYLKQCTAAFYKVRRLLWRIDDERTAN